MEELWAKAFNTVHFLHNELAWCRHLPKEVYNHINRDNLIKLLLRCVKLYEARTDAEKILSLILESKFLLNVAKSQPDRLVKLLKRIGILSFKFVNEYKIFATETF